MEEDKTNTKSDLAIPSLKRLAKIYRASVDAGDTRIADAAESAALEVAGAEAALSRAISLAVFVDDAAV